MKCNMKGFKGTSRIDKLNASLLLIWLSRKHVYLDLNTKPHVVCIVNRLEMI